MLLLCSQLAVAVGKVKVQKPQFDYFSFQPKELEMDDDGKCAVIKKILYKRRKP